MFDYYSLDGLNGLSGLSFVEEKNDALVFWTLTDRGPNADEVEVPNSKMLMRPFMDPSYKPKLIKFSVNKITKEMKILEKLELGLSGIPNLKEHELPLDRFGNVLSKDLHGIDPESLCFLNQHIWIGEEYGPSLLKFNLEGKLIKRFVPEKSYPEDSGFSQVLPAKIKTRKLNRGFEGIACKGDNIYAILQSPLPEDGKNILVFEFNTITEKVERQFYYPLDSMKADKIGDMDYRNGKMYVIEQNSSTGVDSFHKVYEFELDSIKENDQVAKNLTLDLVKEGFHFADKLEGLSILPDGSISVLNDNDFGLSGEWDKKSGTAPQDSSKKSILGIYR